MLEIDPLLTFCLRVFYSFTNEDAFKAKQEVSERSAQGYIPNATVANGNGHDNRIRLLYQTDHIITV